jgi:predicted metal-dependent peptidase
VRPIESVEIMAGDAEWIEYDPEEEYFLAPLMSGTVGLDVWPGEEPPRGLHSPQRSGAAEAYLWAWFGPAPMVGYSATYWVVRVGGVAVVVRYPGDEPFEGLLRALGRSNATAEELSDVEAVLQTSFPDWSPQLVRAERVIRRHFRRKLEEPFLTTARQAINIQWTLAYEEEDSPRRRFEEARQLLLLRFPFFSAAAWNLKLIETPGIGTVSVDPAARCYVDPAWVVKLKASEFAGVLYHELSHLIRMHFHRGQRIGADPKLWNLACDLEINDAKDFRQARARLSLPVEAVRPSEFGLPEGLTAEEYYVGLRYRDADALPLARGIAFGRCGSVASGSPEPWERSPDAAGDGDGLEKKRGAPAESAQGRRPFWQENGDADLSERPSVALEVNELAQRVARSIMSDQTWGNRPGTIPGSWKRWARRRLSSSYDWRPELARAVRGALAEASGMVDYTFRRPSRRSSVLWPVILPALRAPRPDVAVIVDTSGSMSEELLGKALGELEGILKANDRQRVTVYAVDAAVHVVQRVWRAGDVELRGGGGTDMGVGIKAALKQRPRPSLIVVLTDGHTPWPKRPPAVPVVVGLLGRGYAWGPTWATTVSIPA